LQLHEHMNTITAPTKRLDDLLEFCRVAGIQIDPRIELRDGEDHGDTNDIGIATTSTGISVYARDVHIPSETSREYYNHLH
jgi:hypothetical protein